MQDSTPCSRFYVSFPDHYCPSIFIALLAKTAARVGLGCDITHWQNDISQSTLKTSQVLSTHPSKPRILVNFTNCGNTTQNYIKGYIQVHHKINVLLKNLFVQTLQILAYRDKKNQMPPKTQKKKKKNRQNLQKHPACMDKGGTSIYVVQIHCL